jgi:hypothetical protein
MPLTRFFAVAAAAALCSRVPLRPTRSWCRTAIAPRQGVHCRSRQLRGR